MVGLLTAGTFLTQPLRGNAWIGGVARPAGLGLGTALPVWCSCSCCRRMPSARWRRCLCRSLLAGLVAVVLAEMLLLWARLMWALDIAWWWTVLPVVAGCLAATWLRAPHWLLERPGWRGWIAPALAVALPTSFVLTAVPCFRVYQIPWVKPVDWQAPLPLKPDDKPAVVAQGRPNGNCTTGVKA